MLKRRPSFDDAYELRVSLRHVAPEIWRRVRVPADVPLHVLHAVLQIAFGWTGSHLHDFALGDLRFAPVDEEDETLSVDEAGVPLGAIVVEGSELLYHYDFGDSWEHTIVVERILKGGTDTFSCTDGARACPPEDCGGPPGYERLLSALADPKDPEHAESKAWAGRGFDPDKVNLVAVNKRLAAMWKRVRRVK